MGKEMPSLFKGMIVSIRREFIAQEIENVENRKIETIKILLFI